MLKTLLRKNLQEVGSLYFRDKKGGGKRQGGALIGMIVLYVIVFFSLALSFGGMAALFLSSVPAGSDWIAWAVMGIMSVVMASIINAILSYVQLFMAHDNEMLLAMPIPPGTLVLSRMVSVYVMGLVYAAMAWLPTMFVGFVQGKMTVLLFASQLLMLFVQGLLILALTCLFGWLVAFFATKFKNQKFVTVIVCLIFLIGIYALQFKTNALLNQLSSNMDRAGEVIKQSIWPFYQLGHAACGSISAILLFTALAAAILAAAYFLVSKTYIKMSTSKKSGTKAKFKETQIKATSTNKALLKKEATHFVNSVTCMLNSGLGVIIMVAGAIFLFVKGDILSDRIGPIAEAIPEFGQILPLAVIVVICMMESLGTITAASVSLEGKHIWMLQSMPVDPLAVLNAKIQFGVYLQALPGVLLTVALSMALGIDSSNTVLLAVFAAFYGRTSATLGTVLNLKHPNLDWTSEQTPVKRGAPVAFLLFGGWIFGMAVAALGFFTRNFVPTHIFILALVVVLFGIYFYCDKWLKTKGADIFRYL